VFQHVGATATPIDDVTVTWTVVLGPDGLGPSATLTGPNQVAKLAQVPFGGSPSQVSWGEIRTDAQGHLLVLSGVVEGSFSATSRGRIDAHVGSEVALSSWILLLPPCWTPARRPSYSVYDHLVQILGLGVPSPLLFLRDIYPILKALEIGDQDLPAGTPAQHAAVLGHSIWNSGFACSGQITATQHAILAAWAGGPANYVDDGWTSPPPLPSLADSAELDRGPLSRVSFGGWDLQSGAATFLDGLSYFSPSNALRLDLDPPHEYPSFSGFGGWRSDDCSGEWPEIWSTAGNMVRYQSDQTWRTRGFVVRQGGTATYVESTPNPDIFPYVMLLTRRLEFGDVRASATASEIAAIVLEVGHQSAGVSFTLTYPPFLTGPAAYPVPPQVAGEVTTEHIPVTYAPGLVATEQSGTILLQQTGGPLFSVPVHARTVNAIPTEVVFVLDFSFSMHQLCDDGVSKAAKLLQALNTFQALALPTDGVGAVAFNDAILGTLPVAPGADVHGFAAGFTPTGDTSVGGGIQAANAVLAAAAASYTQHALVVVTDGMENTAPLINTVAPTVADPTRLFAVGIGRSQDVDTSKLQALSGNQGGYLLLTGAFGSIDELMLSKYLLRILTNASNLDMLLDPPIVLGAGITRVPFFVSEFDDSFDAIVLSRPSDGVTFALEAPDGSFVTPADLEGIAGCSYRTGANVACYRIRLPLPLLNAPEVAAGTWQLLLRMGRSQKQILTDELQQGMRGSSRKSVRSVGASTARCEVMVQAKSDLHLEATVQQRSLAPGVPMLFEMTLRLKGRPFDGDVRAEARVEGPMGTSFSLALTPEGMGRYVGSFNPVRPGLYRVSLVCEGTTPGLHRFRREQLATAAVLDERGAKESWPTPEHGARGCLRDLLACCFPRAGKGEWKQQLCSLGRKWNALCKRFRVQSSAHCAGPR
jgi:hypothetical protein